MTKFDKSQWTLGILGGSGLYDLEGLENPEWVSVNTPWGAPSDDILFAEIGGVRLRFLPRHGRGHAISPSDVNYRANIDALKRSGCFVHACQAWLEMRLWERGQRFIVRRAVRI